MNRDGRAYRLMLNYFIRHNVYLRDMKKFIRTLKVRELTGWEMQMDDLFEKRAFSALSSQLSAMPFRRV
jgi:hypothetical protein